MCPAGPLRPFPPAVGQERRAARLQCGAALLVWTGDPPPAHQSLRAITLRTRCLLSAEPIAVSSNPVDFGFMSAKLVLDLAATKQHTLSKDSAGSRDAFSGHRG